MPIPPTVAAVANDIGEKCQIIVGSVGYIFTNGQPMVFQAQHSSNPNAVFVGSSDYLTMRDYDYFSRVFLNNWQRGAGQIVLVVDDPTSKTRFYDSTGVDVHDAGRFYCVRALIGVGDPTAGRSNLTTAGAGYLYLSVQGGVDFSTTWGVPSHANISDATNKQVGRLVTDGQYVYGTVAGLGINRWTIGSTTAGTNWNATITAGTRLLYANRVFYALDGANFYSLTTGGVATTQFTPPTGWTLTDLCSKRGGAISAPILILGNTGTTSFVWYWDGTNLNDYLEMPSNFVGLRMKTYLNVTYILGYRVNPDASSSPCVYYIANDQLGFLGYLGTQQTNGNPTAAGVTTLATYAIDAYDNFVYFMVVIGSNTEIWRYDIVNGGLTRYVINAVPSTVPTDMVIWNGGPVFVDSAAGIQKTSTTFYSGASLDTSDIHLGQPWATNLWVTIEITHSKLNTSESISIQYSLDQGNSWTSTDAGGNSIVSNTVGATSKQFTISNASTSQKSSYIRFRITLTPNGGTSTPSFQSLAIRAAPTDPVGLEATFTVGCPDRMVMPNGQPDWQGLSGQERIYNIVNLYETQSIVNLIYLAPNNVRGKNPKTVPVKIVDYQVTSQPPVVHGGKEMVLEGDVKVTVRQTQ